MAFKGGQSEVRGQWAAGGLCPWGALTNPFLVGVVTRWPGGREHLSNSLKAA